MLDGLLKVYYNSPPLTKNGNTKMFDLTLTEILRLTVKEQTIYNARRKGYISQSKGDDLSYDGMNEDSAYAEWMR